MKKYWKVIGIVSAVAGALYYPTLKLVRMILKKRADLMKKATAESEHMVKAFSPAYRGKHKPHHRHN